MRKFLFNIWMSIGTKFFLKTYSEWLKISHEQFAVDLREIVDFAFETYEPTLEDWVEITNNRFPDGVEGFKAAAYNYRIKLEAGMADDLGIGDAYRWGSDTAKAEQEALEAAKRGKKVLPGGILALGKTPEERRHTRLMERDDLLISNMVKEAAKGAGVDPIL